MNHRAFSTNYDDLLLVGGYVKDPSRRLWLDPSQGKFDYSDGDEVEQRLESAVLASADVSLFSNELLAHQVDWPSVYHLSPTRANLLRPIETHLAGKNVLEIGAGCGAITRFLGERGANVLALEGSPRRAAIAASRCRDLENVTTLNARFDTFSTTVKFDVVTLIGVLEYARIYASGIDPIQEMLEQARSLLKEDGILLIAIENQLGLKYFAGVNEDHLGRPMAGIQDQYDAKSVVTFGKSELEGRILSSGFACVETALPFPDYKLPQAVVLPMGYAANSAIDAASLAGQAARSDRQMVNPPHFSLKQAFKVVGRNELLADLSNSFLILAGKSVASPGFGDLAKAVLAEHYATERQPRYTKRARFVQKPNGIEVLRELLCPEAPPLGSKLIAHSVNDEPYWPGENWGDRLESIVSKDGWSVDQVADWLAVWRDALGARTSRDIATDPFALDSQLDGELFDALAANLVIGKDGPSFFDLEWSAKNQITFGFLAFRCLSVSMTSVSMLAAPDDPNLLHLPTLMRAIFRNFGILLTGTEIQSFIDMEASFQDEIKGQVRRAPGQTTVDQFSVVPTSESALIAEDQAALSLAQLREQNEQLKQRLAAEGQHVYDLEVRVGDLERISEANDRQFEAKKEELQSMLSEAANRASQVQSRHDDLLSDAFRSTAQLSEIAAALSLEQARSNSLATQLQAAEQRVAAGEQALSVFEASVNESGENGRSLSRQLEVLGAEIVEKDNEIHRLWAHAEELAAQIESGNANRSELDFALNYARTFEISAGQLRAELDLIKGSTSWALTSPLRALSAAARAARLAVVRTSGRWLEKIYRAAPISFANKRKLKGFFFSRSGWLFSGTNAYRRWDADIRTRGAAVDYTALGAPVQTDYLQTSWAPADALWMADGIREWSDYGPIRDRIKDALALKSQNKQTAPVSLLDFNGGNLEKIARSIRLPEPPAAPEVTILVPAYNHLATTLECLSSIAAAAETAGPSFEVLVADDASTDSSATVLAHVAHLRLFTQPHNLGFLKNCNSMLGHIRGRYLLLLNNDVQVTKGWLSALVESIAADSSIGAVGPKIVYPSGWLQEAGTRLRRDGSAEMIGLNDLPSMPQFSYSRDVDYCSGACLLLRSEDFRSMGGFDESYAPAYCEDSDLCMRLRKLGRRIRYCADATVFHHLSVTSDDLPSDYKLECISRNLATFSSHWRADLETLDQVRTIAFYLPQFHPIPENDLWWGQGFTEWTNVSKAQPNFQGHYQPRLPADLGYYDLRLTEVMEKQADLARRYGLGGFCYYYYWFGGQRLLERPIEQMLQTQRPDFPFCLCWANENWTRRWDGQEHDVLMAQSHSDQDDLAVIRDLMRFFRSPNYIRINGRPLILVYRVTLFPNFARTAALWRQVCLDEGIGEIYIAQVESFELVTAGIHPSQMGCDAAVEFPPQGMAEPHEVTAPLLNPNFNGVVADYRDLAVRYATRDLPAYNRFMGVMPGWDNTARRQNSSYSFEHASPGAFQAWLETAVSRTKQQYSGGERLVFINAWNEWAEGAYLEPDRRFGHSFLQAHANALDADYLLRRG